MPKIEFKEETLNGRACIVAYADREYLTLRIPRGNKRYSCISLGTTNLKVAHDKALDIYAATINQPINTRTSKYGFRVACRDFLGSKQDEACIGAIKESSVDGYSQRIYQRIIPYAEHVGVKNVGDIKKETFEEYGNYYRKVKVKGKWKNNTDGLAVSTINSDLSTLNELIGWLIQENILDANNRPIIKKLRNRKEFKENTNPAFTLDEWQALKDYMNVWLKNQDCDDELMKWRKRWMYNWIFFMYHFGGRYHEAMLLTLGDITTRKMPDGKLMGIVEVSPTTKTGKRIAVMNGYWLNSVKYHLIKGIELRNQQIEDHNKIVDSGEIKNYRWRFQGKIKLLPKPNKDTPLFLNPLFHIINKDDKKSMRKFEEENRLDDVRWEVATYSSQQIRNKYSFLVENAMVFWHKCDTKLIDCKKFTLDSLRSTHIAHNLLNIEGIGMHQKIISLEDELTADPNF